MSGIQQNSATNSVPNLVSVGNYFKLFRMHWDQGTGREGRIDPFRKGWTTTDFLNRMQKVGHSVSDDTVKNWLQNKSFPHRRQHETIVKVYFGASESNRGELSSNAARDEFEAAWQMAEDSRHERIEKRPRITENDPSFEWQIFACNGIDGLTEVRLHQPRLGNEPGTYFIDATIRIDRIECEPNGITIFIGLRDVFLSLTSPSYQAAKGTMIGERSTQPHVRVTVGGVEFNGPRDKAHGCLVGDLLGEEYIAVIEPTREIEHPITVMLHAGRRSFSVARGNDKDGNSGAEMVGAEKDAVLNALIYKGRPKDGLGRAILAQSRMRRIPRT
jgi:hypothetical protein